MTWIDTNRKTGPLTTNSYTMSITGLSPSTLYCYRAVIIVDGQEYYGDIKTGVTSDITYYAPSVRTGTAYLDDACPTNKIRIDNNEIINNGGLPIIEYGVLYTSFSAYGTNCNLILDNYSTHVQKKAINDNGQTNPFFNYPNNDISDLNDNTTYYYRAYACNVVGAGYGDVKEIITQTQLNNINITIYWNGDCTDAYSGFGGYLRLYCCDNNQIKEFCINNYSKIYKNSYNVNLGCYYFRFDDIIARCNSNNVETTYTYEINQVTETDAICTDYFKVDNDSIIHFSLGVSGYCTDLPPR